MQPDRSRSVSWNSAQIELCRISSLCETDNSRLNDMVDMCPLTKCEDGLQSLHDVNDGALIWLKSTVTTVLVKLNEVWWNFFASSCASWLDFL